MKRLSTPLLLVICMLILLVSCKGTSSKMNDFVMAYNRTMQQAVSNSVIYSTSAEAVYNKKIIKIKIVTNYSSMEANDEMTAKMLPSMFMELLRREDMAKELINEEGVDFEVSFFTNRLSEFSTLLVDKKKLAELEKEAPKNLKRSDFNSIPIGEDRSDQKGIRSMLVTLNQNLPFKIKDTGLTITRIDINAANELIYEVKVPQDLAERMKGKDAADILKDEILRKGNFRQIMTGIRSFGISTIKYQYQDEKGHLLNEVVLTQKDLD